MLAQSVLLRGVNDDAETLGALLRALVECRIKPYYLHHADLAPGTAHLRTTIAEGQSLMRALHGRYSGPCQPTYVLDIPGGHGKSPIGPNYLSEDGAVIEDFAAGCTPMRRAASRCGEKYRGLEFVAACLARPSVAHAALIEIFGPVGSEQPSLALRASVLVVGDKPRGERGLGMESHDSSSLNHPLRPTRTLGLLCGSHVTDVVAFS